MADLPPHEALPFPPITAQHILNCSYHNWHPKFRSRTPKARLIPLTPAFINYLKSDGIVLPPESHQARSTSHDADNDSGYSDDDEDSDTEDPSEAWPEIHAQIQETIKELGGKVLPKLNWSAPKDATWISTTNDMDCQSANDVYLLLKSSDFITHDLEQAFDGCVDGEGVDIPYHLVLRKSFQLNPSVEFRCFVRDGKLIAISQREMNHFEFLFGMRNQLRRVIEENIPDFADPNFVFDVYIPPPHEKVWLIDINPWAPRTDPLLFSWLELLTMDDLGDELAPEMRLVQRDDPEAYQFASTKYSAHKMPKDVVDASMTPGGMKDMLEEWRRAQEKEDEEGQGTNAT